MPPVANGLLALFGPSSFLTYAVLFILAIVEGPVIMTLSGFLLRLGHLYFVPLYIVLMGGDLAADSIWYGIGYHWGDGFVRRFGKFFSVTEEAVQKIKGLFENHHNKILFISKVTMGFGFAIVTLLAAGISKVPFKKYILFNFLGQFIWTALLIFLGYSFGALYLQINHALQLVSLIGFIVILLLVLYGTAQYLREKTTKE